MYRKPQNCSVYQELFVCSSCAGVGEDDACFLQARCCLMMVQASVTYAISTFVSCVALVSTYAMPSPAANAAASDAATARAPSTSHLLPVGTNRAKMRNWALPCLEHQTVSMSCFSTWEIQSSLDRLLRCCFAVDKRRT